MSSVFAGHASAVLFLMAALAIHEFGHWVAMRRYGIEVDAVGIGFSPPRCKRWSATIYGIPVLFGILPLGAYLRKSKEGQRRLISLPFQEQSLVYGAGIMANLFFAAAILDALLFYKCGGSWRMVTVPLFWAVTLPPVAVWFGRRVFCSFLPVIGIVAAASTAAWCLHVAGGLGLVGPVGLVRYTVGASPTFVMAAINGAIISLGWGALNAIPFVPFDGWSIFEILLRREKPGWVRPLFIAEFAVYALVAVVALSHDFHF